MISVVFGVVQGFFYNALSFKLLVSIHVFLYEIWDIALKMKLKKKRRMETPDASKISNLHVKKTCFQMRRINLFQFDEKSRR